ncbi:MAG: pyridoxamine 5'-phosphate oxidase family protein [Chloroflexi bacterium]|nr:pyridoxamine 5'-phosphate oxidase family protein [Chloroflexota bacterium]
MTKKQSDTSSGISASRPRIPAAYGIPKHTKGLLPWAYVTERMVGAPHYWVCTTSPNGRPHATPVDGLWLDDRLYFTGSPETRRNRNLAANPQVCVHLDSGREVLILYGEAHLRTPDDALAIRLAKASNEKYGYGNSPSDYKASGVNVFEPRVVLTWREGMKDATRWRIRTSEKKDDT